MASQSCRSSLAHDQVLYQQAPTDEDIYKSGVRCTTNSNRLRSLGALVFSPLQNGKE